MARTFNRRGGYSQAFNCGFRSGLEETIAKQLELAGVNVCFEKYKLSYEIPATAHKYTPDFVLPNGIIVEGKGLFEPSDRKKHLLIKEQYPHLDIRFVFTNPNTKINKGSKTTYGDWCTKNGFQFATKVIPDSWLREKQHCTEGLVEATKGKK